MHRDRLALGNATRSGWPTASKQICVDGKQHELKRQALQRFEQCCTACLLQCLACGHCPSDSGGRKLPYAHICKELMLLCTWHSLRLHSARLVQPTVEVHIEPSS